MKKIFSLSLMTVMSIMMIFLFTVSAFATDVDVTESIVPIEYYKYSQAPTASISISANGTATVNASINGIIGKTTKLTVDCQLQKYVNGSWNKIDSWQKTVNGLSLTIEKSKKISKGTYRTHVVFHSYSVSGKEEIVINSSKDKY